MLDPTALLSTLRTRALTRQADWAPKSEVGLVECGLLNPGPPAHPPVRPTARPAVRTIQAPTAQSTRPPDRLSTRPPVRLSERVGPCSRLVGPVRLSAPLSTPFSPPSARPSAAFPPRPLVRSSARPRRQRPSARPLWHASSATSARPHETVAAIYTPPRLPSDHPAPRSPRWASSLCCAFKDCGTARGSRTSGGWSELRGKSLQFFFAQQALWRGRPFTSRETGLQQQLRVQD